jgi:hypothetical protein
MPPCAIAARRIARYAAGIGFAITFPPFSENVTTPRSISTSRQRSFETAPRLEPTYASVERQRSSEYTLTRPEL